MAGRLTGVPHPLGDAAEHAVCPPNHKEPCPSSRFAACEQMYARLGLDRDDRPARLKWLANNYNSVFTRSEPEPLENWVKIV